MSRSNEVSFTVETLTWVTGESSTFDREYNKSKTSLIKRTVCTLYVSFFRKRKNFVGYVLFANNSEVCQTTSRDRTRFLLFGVLPHTRNRCRREGPNHTHIKQGEYQRENGISWYLPVGVVCVRPEVPRGKVVTIS